MARSSPVFVCAECGGETLKWQGQCPHCSAWNSLEQRAASARAPASATRNTPRSIGADLAGGDSRFGTGQGELDRVLGGGLVKGSVTLLGGDPGIGKSTLLLQVASHVAGAQRRNRLLRSGMTSLSRGASRVCTSAHRETPSPGNIRRQSRPAGACRLVMPAARSQNTIVQLVRGEVTTARTRFQTLAVEDRDLAAAVADQRLPLQGRRCLRYTDATHAEHVGENLVRCVEVIRARAIVRHQQPPCQASLDDVEANAGCRLRDLLHLDVRVAVEPEPQRRAALEFVPQRRRADAQRHSGTVHEMVQRRNRRAEQNGYSDHAFAANQNDLEPGACAERSNQRDGAADREIHVALQHPALVQDFR